VVKITNAARDGEVAALKRERDTLQDVLDRANKRILNAEDEIRHWRAKYECINERCIGIALPDVQGGQMDFHGLGN
jgi:predicted  nucleic acid-binding Zn-ribbon protein